MNLKYGISFLILFSLGARFQYISAQDPVFGMINMSASTANPAFTGWNNKWTAGVNYQNMTSGNWTNESTNLYGEYNKGAHAVGLNIYSDASMILRTRKLMANYAYHYYKENYGVRLGVGLGFAQKEMDFTKFKFIDPSTIASFPDMMLRSYGLVNLGAVGYYKNIYLSVAAHNVNNPNVSFYHNKTPGSYLPVRYHLQLGGYIPVSKHFVIYPNIRYNQQKQFNMLMPEVQIAFNNFVIGCSKVYSIKADNLNLFNFNTGVTMKKKYKIGYMYNYYQLDNLSYATHEVSFVFMMNTSNSKCGENVLSKYMRKFL